MSGQPIEPLPSTDGCYTVWERSADETGQFRPNYEIKAGLKPEDIHWYCFEIPLTGSKDTPWPDAGPLWSDAFPLNGFKWAGLSSRGRNGQAR
jgi:hypothetical protein